MPGTEVLGLQLLAVSDCPFKTSGSSAFLRRIWSKDRKRAEMLLSIVFQNILYEISCASPTTRLVLRISGTRHHGEPIATPNIISIQNGYPFSQHLLLAWVIHSICLESFDFKLKKPNSNSINTPIRQARNCLFF